MNLIRIRVLTLSLPAHLDIFRGDGTPYSVEETDLIRSLTSSSPGK